MSEKAHNINSVVLTITKVAAQTNLLSLNPHSALLLSDTKTTKKVC